MKRLLQIFSVALVVLFLCAPAQAAITYTGHHLQGKSSDGNTFTTGTMSVTAGNLVIVAVAWYQPTTPTLTASGGNSLTADITTQSETVLTSEKIYYIKSVLSTGTISFTLTGTASFGAIVAAEFSGADTSAPLDKQNGGTSSSASTFQAGSISPVASSLVIAAIAGFGSNDFDSIDTGFTVTDVSTKTSFAFGVSLAYLIPSDASDNPTWTATGGTVNNIAGTNASFLVASACTPAKVVFTSQPSNAVVGASLGTVQVSVQDSGSVTCTGDTSNVTLSADGGATWATLASASSLTKAAVAGVATWTDLSVSPTTGTGSIHAADAALTPATSTSITISAPSATTNHGMLSGVN